MTETFAFSGQKRILFCVLNWGLGHATRSGPLVQKALESGCKVHIASDGIALKFLKNQFPSCTFITLPGYQVKYVLNSMPANILIQTPRLSSTYLREKRLVEEFVQSNSIDMIISDNRFGCYSRYCTSVYITHQLTILHNFKWVSFTASLIHSLIYTKFDQIWVPDNSGINSLSGRLGHTPFKWIKPVTTLGILSRLNPVPPNKNGFQILILLSGPEPQREILELKLTSILRPLCSQILLIRGTDKDAPMMIQNDYNFINLATTQQVEQAIANAKWIICRSGYTTIMDLAVFNPKSTIFIPTPGQTEQEYLAEYHQQRSSKVHVIPQANLDEKLIDLIGSYF